MRRRTVLLAVAALAVPAARAQTAFVPYPRRDDVRDFIDDVTTRNDLKRAWVERVFAHGRHLPAVERLMQPPIPFGSRNWLEYRARYLDERRIRDGAAFMKEQRVALERAALRYGVPPEIVTAILGVETRYGRFTGDFRTLDVLLTLSFDYLRRADYFRSELEHFLLLAREQRLDPLAVRGSFAGAIGMPQFMPSSVRRWAVDFDGNGRVELARSVDSIGSVANFLVEHGWLGGEPLLVPARLSSEKAEAEETTLESLAEQFSGGIRADTPWSVLAGSGVEVDVPLALDAPVLLIDLPIVAADGTQRREYRIGDASFASILYYNRSYFYAVSVVELAHALRAAV